MKIKRIIVMVFVCVYSFAGNVAQGAFTEGQEQFLREFAGYRPRYNDSITTMSVLVDNIFRDLTSIEVLRCWQKRYGLSNSEVAVVLNALLFGERKEVRGLSHNELLNLLCQPDYANNEFREYVENQMMTNDTRYCVYYLRVTDHVVTNGPIMKILRDDKRYGLENRRNIYRELARAYNDANSLKRRQILSDLKACIVDEYLRAQKLDTTKTASRTKLVIFYMDKFLKRYPDWAKSADRLAVLEFMHCKIRNPVVIKWDRYFSAEIASLKRYLAVRRFAASLTFDLVSPNYVYSRPMSWFLLVLKLISFVGLLFLVRHWFVRRQQKKGSNPVERQKEQIGVEASDPLLKVQQLPKTTIIESGNKNYGMSRWGFCVGLLFAAFFVVMLPHVYKYGLSLGYAGIIDYKGMVIFRNGLVLSLVLIIVSLLFLFAMRFRNAGLSSWNVLFLFVPLIGIFALIWCLSYQTRYIDTKNLDRFGKVVSGVAYLLMFLIFVFFLLFWFRSTGDCIRDVFFIVDTNPTM